MSGRYYTVRAKSGAQGSHATFEHYPRVCAICEQPARITTDPDGLTFETLLPEDVPRTYHTVCRRKARQATA